MQIYKKQKNVLWGLKAFQPQEKILNPLLFQKLVLQKMNFFAHGLLQNVKEEIPLITKSNWNFSLRSQKPTNLLFSTDQFVFEFSKKKPPRKKLSEFSRQLKERKKFTLFYGDISKKHLLQYFQQANKFSGCFSKNFLSLMEKRLDTILFRTGLAQNIFLARQLIIHKQILINKMTITNPNYLLKPADIISLKIGIKKKLQQNRAKTLVFPGNKPLQNSRVSQGFSTNYSYFITKMASLKDSQKNPSKRWVDHFVYFLIKLSKNRIIYKKKQGEINLTQNHSHVFVNTKNHIFTPTMFFENTSTRFSKFLLLLKLKAFMTTHAKNTWLKKQHFFHKKDFLSCNHLSSHQIKSPVQSQNSTAFAKIHFCTPFFNAQTAKTDFYKSTSKAKTAFSTRKKTSHKNYLLNLLKIMQISQVFHHCFSNKLKKYFLKNDSNKVFLKALRIVGKKPVHFEISYKNFIFIFLYPPQRVSFPFYLDTDLIERSLY